MIKIETKQNKAILPCNGHKSWFSKGDILGNRRGAIYWDYKCGKIKGDGMMRPILIEDIIQILGHQPFAVDELQGLTPAIFEGLINRWGPRTSHIAIRSIYALGRMAGIHAERVQKKTKV